VFAVPFAIHVAPEERIVFLFYFFLQHRVLDTGRNTSNTVHNNKTVRLFSYSEGTISPLKTSQGAAVFEAGQPSSILVLNYFAFIR
jgi:hypothetical protein